MSKRPARRRAPSHQKPTSGRLLPAADSVVVRMYRQGLGDCFLLALDDRPEPRYILIDCGVHHRQTDGRARLAQVLDDIMQATGGHLHDVVVTHPHADHLSGFVQNGSPFLNGGGRLVGPPLVDALWLAWSEAPDDPQAQSLRKNRRGRDCRSAVSS